MRIGTWNLEGKWSPDHEAVLLHLNCDVLLLTEPPVVMEFGEYRSHTTSRLMGPSKYWAAILTTRSMKPVDDPHPASAAAYVDDSLVCSSVLPWSLANEHWPWGSAEHQAPMEETLDQLTSVLSDKVSVWGGDWNQPLTGNLSGFRRSAQSAILAAVDCMRLQVPTADLPSSSASQRSIDHIALPQSWVVRANGHIPVVRDLSDHYAYWVEVEPPLDAGMLAR